MKFLKNKNITKFCKEEYKGYVIYSELAKGEKDPKRAEILESLALDEKRHYKFWKRLSKEECEARVSKIEIFIVKLLRTVFGLTFTLKLLERGETEAINEYKEFLNSVKGEERDELERIIEDESRHERELLGQIDEKILKYMSFIVLGLADAIVEITGVHAGFLGVTDNTIMAGIAGLVVGFSAAISMASAAYLQAKQEVGKRSPGTSAMATGLAYIGAVVALALPYFLIHSMLKAFTISLSIGVILIATFNYYSSIVLDKRFLREFAESAGLMLATAFASYFFGDALGSFFKIRGIFS